MLDISPCPLAVDRAPCSCGHSKEHRPSPKEGHGDPPHQTPFLPVSSKDPSADRSSWNGSTLSPDGRGDNTPPPPEAHGRAQQSKARPPPACSERRAKPRLTLASRGLRGPPALGERRLRPWKFDARLSVGAEVFSPAGWGLGLVWGSPRRHRGCQCRQTQDAEDRGVPEF